MPRLSVHPLLFQFLESQIKYSDNLKYSMADSSQKVTLQVQPGSKNILVSTLNEFVARG